MAISRSQPSLLRSCLTMLVCAVVGGVIFNWLMPQGIGLLPPEVRSPLWQTIGPEEAKAWRDKGAIFLDSREAGDYGQSRLRGALKLPAGEVEKLYRFMEPSLKAAPALVVYGQSVSRFPAATLAQYLRRKGYENVFVLEGCMQTLGSQGFDIQEVRRQGAKP